ncbi:adenylate/guanylate cyclase domain-containing protein [Sneathiella litorea]|uniref:CHASE2 domain-containing protein n=1 Tax=Sneathiella litorea TaxID=2606216 RepID=A0A6L8W5Y3_9PROT|nr:adenylate/guanylate cyclase domain-containing protein [Sneathiella litorea]MZR29864.1 CHASE2 domain-containing protein [Sneathiella litorea]
MTKSLPSPITRMSQAMIVLGICAALIVAFVNLRDKPFIQLIEGQLLDWRFILRGPIPVDTSIELVLIEAKPGETGDNLPVSATDLMKGINAISAAGARIIVLDPMLLPMKAPGDALPDTPEEKSLTDELARIGNVIVPYIFSMTPSVDARTALPAVIQQTAYSVFRTRESASIKRPPEAGGYLAPNTELLRSVISGHVISSQQQALTRQFAYPVIGYGGSYYPSLAVQTYRKWAGFRMESIEVNFGESLNFGNIYLPTDNRMRLAVNYHGPTGSYKRTRFSDLAEGTIPTDGFKEKVILVGLAASANGNNFTTPFDSSMSEVEFLANVIDNLNRMNPLIRSQQVIVFDILLLALLGLFFALVSAVRSIWAVLSLSVIATALFVAGNVEAFIFFNLWLGLTFPLMAMILCTAVLMTAKHVSRRRRAALISAEAAEETQFAASWTFDRVAKPLDADETNPEKDEDNGDFDPKTEDPELASPSIKKEEVEASEPTPREEPAPVAPEPMKEAETAGEVEKVHVSQNVTPFPTRKPQAPVPSSLPIPPTPPTLKPAIAEKETTGGHAPAQKGKKPPASLIPVMDAPARGEKVSITSAPTMASPSSAGKKFDVAVLFINMGGFKALAKSFGPTRSAQFLHAIYSLIEKTVVKHNGFLEQFGEDDVVALFGLPNGSSGDAEHSLRAACELASALSEWGERQGIPADKSADFCVCAHYGPVQAHISGDEDDPEVSLSGYTIGLVSRLEKTVAAKGARVLVSELLMEKVRETDLTGQLKVGFTEQPMQQIPGGAEMIGLWRSEVGAS